MLSNKKIICPYNLLNSAIKNKGADAGIVNAGKPLPMMSVMDAVKENLINPIFIGDEKQIKECASDIKWDISNFKIIHEPNENKTASIVIITHIANELNCSKCLKSLKSNRNVLKNPTLIRLF